MSTTCYISHYLAERTTETTQKDWNVSPQSKYILKEESISNHGQVGSQVEKLPVSKGMIKHDIVIIIDV